MKILYIAVFVVLLLATALFFALIFAADHRAKQKIREGKAAGDMQIAVLGEKRIDYRLHDMTVAGSGAYARTNRKTIVRLDRLGNVFELFPPDAFDRYCVVGDCISFINTRKGAKFSYSVLDGKHAEPEIGVTARLAHGVFFDKLTVYDSEKTIEAGFLNETLFNCTFVVFPVMLFMFI